MRRYRSKPRTVEAIQWRGDNVAEIQEALGEAMFGEIDPEDRGDDPDQTAELWVAANGTWLPLVNGEWVLRDGLGCYPCKASVFADSYEPVPTRGRVETVQLGTATTAQKQAKP